MTLPAGAEHVNGKAAGSDPHRRRGNHATQTWGLILFIIARRSPNTYFVGIGGLDYREVADLAGRTPVRSGRSEIIAVADLVALDLNLYRESSLAVLFELHAIDDEAGLQPYLGASQELRRAILDAWSVRPIRDERILTYAEIIRRMSWDFSEPTKKTRFDLTDL